MISRHVSTEARDEIDALKLGRSPEQFLDHMWLERYCAKPQPEKSSGKFPIVREKIPSNVFQFKARAKA